MKSGHRGRRVASLALAAGLAAGVFAASGPVAHAMKPKDKLPVDWRPIEIAVTPLQLRGDKAVGEPIAFEGLSFIGAAELTSPERWFGGLSGLLVDPKDGSFLAVSDRGHWLRARPTFDADGRLVALDGAEMAQITDKKRRVIDGYGADAESLAFIGEDVCVGFERRDRIDCYREDADDELVFRRRFADLADEPLDNNEGVEAMVAAPDGGVIALSQTTRPELSLGWRIDADGARAPFFYKQAEGFSVTDMTARAGGGLLVLERAFSPFRGLRMRLADVDAGELAAAAAAGGVVESRTLIELGPLYPVDNMEAVASVVDEFGRSFVYVLSDDNFNDKQRTLFLVFELTP